MTTDPNKRLESHGAADVPPIDASFADRLESKLRHDHSLHTSTRRARGLVLLPRLGFALMVVIAGIAGVVALTSRDAGVPVEVIDGEPIAPAAAPEVPDGEADSNALDPTATPTPQATVDTSTLTVASPSAVPAVAAEPTATPGSAVSSPEPIATIVVPPSPTAIPSVTPLPTSAPAPTATVVPASTPTTVPTPTTMPQATTQPRPTPTPETPLPERLLLDCGLRRSNDVVGVVCTWDVVGIDSLTHYVVIRSRNDGEAAVVSRQSSVAPTTYVDRDVERGDQVVYLVRGLAADGTVLAASVRQTITIPGN